MPWIGSLKFKWYIVGKRSLKLQWTNVVCLVASYYNKRGCIIQIEWTKGPFTRASMFASACAFSSNCNMFMRMLCQMQSMGSTPILCVWRNVLIDTMLSSWRKRKRRRKRWCSCEWTIKPSVTLTTHALSNSVQKSVRCVRYIGADPCV